MPNKRNNKSKGPDSQIINELKQALASNKARNKRLNRAQIPQGQFSVTDVVVGKTPVGAVNDAIMKTSMGRSLRARGVDLHYSRLGDTEDGRLFALCNLSPCSEDVTGSAGIPDQTQGNATTPTFRDQLVILWDASLFSTPPTPPADFNFDVQIVILPHPEIAFIYRIAYQGTWSRWKSVRTTVCPIINGDGANYTTLETLGASKHRGVGRGATVHQIAATLSDQGQLIAGQVAPVVYRETVNHSTTADPASSGQTSIWSYYVPRDENELVQQDPQAVQWDSRKGCYMPLRYLDPTQLYENVATGQAATAQTGEDPVTNGPVPSSIIEILATNQSELGGNTDAFVPEGNWQPPLNAPLMNGSCAGGVSNPMNYLVGVMFFKGIANTTSLQVKMRTHMECQVLGNTPMAPFAHGSPIYDCKAIENVTQAAQVLPHAFYASDNDLGGIFKWIANALPAVGDFVNKLGVPIVSPVGGLVADLMRRFGWGIKRATKEAEKLYSPSLD